MKDIDIVVAGIRGSLDALQWHVNKAETSDEAMRLWKLARQLEAEIGKVRDAAITKAWRERYG